MDQIGKTHTKRNLIIAAAVAVFAVAVFMTGVVNYGNYQQAHRIKYLTSVD